MDGVFGLAGAKGIIEMPGDDLLQDGGARRVAVWIGVRMGEQVVGGFDAFQAVIEALAVQAECAQGILGAEPGLFGLVEQQVEVGQPFDLPLLRR